MRLSNQIVLASTNRGKFEEFRDLLKPYSQIELLSAEEIVRNPAKLKHAEQYSTYLENSAAKARLINLASHYPALADDSGLEVEALAGKPGVYSARYAPPVAGLSQDQANVRRLLEDLKDASNLKARFVCTLSLVIEGILIHSTGVLEGTLIRTPRGENGFGYDPIFVPSGSSKTLAEMSDVEKNTISHRAKALQDLMNQAKAHSLVFAKP